MAVADPAAQDGHGAWAAVSRAATVRWSRRWSNTRRSGCCFGGTANPTRNTADSGGSPAVGAGGAGGAGRSCGCWLPSRRQVSFGTHGPRNRSRADGWDITVSTAYGRRGTRLLRLAGVSRAPPDSHQAIIANVAAVARYELGPGYPVKVPSTVQRDQRRLGVLSDHYAASSTSAVIAGEEAASAAGGFGGFGGLGDVFEAFFGGGTGSRGPVGRVRPGSGLAASDAAGISANARPASRKQVAVDTRDCCATYCHEGHPR